MTANSTVAPSSDASTGATATPYGSPGTPSASGQNGAENQKNLSFSWSSPSTTTNDVAYTQISIDNGGWERVAASGSRTVNTGGFNEPHHIRVQTVNSLGTGGPIASASAQSGAEKTRWTTRLNGGMTAAAPTCPGHVLRSTAAAELHLRRQERHDRPWMAPSDVFDIMCWKPHGTTYSGDGQWYYIMRGSPNQTRWINSTAHHHWPARAERRPALHLPGRSDTIAAPAAGAHRPTGSPAHRAPPERSVGCRGK